MIFSSLTFVFLFLPAVLALYFISPRRTRNLILFLSSLLFYSWGEPVYVFVMLFTILFDYVSGILIESCRESGKDTNARLFFVGTVVMNLAVLGFFKYSNFIIGNINSFFHSQIPLLELELPIGISFYTFQILSYVIDVYWGKVKAQKNFIDFGCYVTLFPQLVAGPIVQYKDVAAELRQRTESFENFSYGIKRFSLGLFKKVILANGIGYLWNQITAGELGAIPVLTAWLGAISFTFQIYFDFSGYSDMAIGLGRMFGFHFLENFDHPYRAKSITEFWRRWHISLSTWFRDYVYIPLGGSRKGKARLVRNILAVWGLTGFWHGASWNFILWGLYFGILLILEKFIVLRFLKKLPSMISHIYTMTLVVISWVIFAFDDVRNVAAYIRAMFGANGAGIFHSETMFLLDSNFILLVLCAFISVGVVTCGWTERLRLYTRPAAYWVTAAGSLALLFISVCFLLGESYNPFLYFRF